MTELNSTRVPKIKIRGLSKAFGSKVVLDKVDLDIHTGESVLVIGGSGSGKSVLLKCILGLLHPDAGSIQVDGEEVVGLLGEDLDRVRRKFGMLFQNAALFDSLTVWENVAFGLIQGQRKPRDEARAIAMAKLADVGLGADVGELMPAELSGGMRKRVGLARAIATEPEIIFFDEPTTGLDPIMGDVIDQLIVKCVKELGATALSITHDMASARRISDRVAMLYQGKIIWVGATAKIDRVGQRLCRSVHQRARGGPDPKCRSAHSSDGPGDRSPGSGPAQRRIGGNHGQSAIPLCLPGLRRRGGQVVGALRGLRRLELDRPRKCRAKTAPGGLSARGKGRPKRSSSSTFRAKASRSRAGPAAWPSSTASPAAAWFPAQPCWWPAIRASASRPSCFRSPPASPAAARIRPRFAPTSRARNPSNRSACAHAAWAWRRPRSNSPRQPRSAICWPELDQPQGPAVVIVDSIQTHVYRQPRIGAGHRLAGPRGGPGADPPSQEARLQPAAGRPCHQGGP